MLLGLGIGVLDRFRALCCHTEHVKACRIFASEHTGLRAGLDFGVVVEPQLPPLLIAFLRFLAVPHNHNFLPHLLLTIIAPFNRV